MHKYLYISVLSFLVCSCGSKGEDVVISTPKEEVNVAPSIPILVYPTDNLLCIDNTLDFQWEASTDGNGDAVTYQVDVSKDSQFSEIEHSASGGATNRTFTLEKGVAYYWRVRALDSKNAESNFTATFSLYTEGEGITNHLPFAPAVVNPVLDGVEQQGTVSLEWTSSDTDGDPLTYDVYFGTENPPTELISEDQDLSTLDINTGANTVYFWKIVAKDDRGGHTIGQIWQFKTD